MILHRACGYSSSDFQYIDAWKDSWKEWKIWGLMSHRTVRIGEPHLGSNLSTIKISNPKITAVR